MILIGISAKSDYCNDQECPRPVNCQWSNWSLHGQCTKTCGGGIQVWTRTELVKASSGGRPCQGNNIKSEACNVQECPRPVNCQWSNWAIHGQCTKTCGGGIQTWIRTELMRASNGGRLCQGSNIKYEVCNVQQCLHVFVSGQIHNIGSQIGTQVTINNYNNHNPPINNFNK